MSVPEYLHLRAGQEMPHLTDARPFKAVLVIEEDVTPAWQALVSEWLVRGGCRYMMAWGKNCSRWDDSVDEANVSVFGSNLEGIPEDDFVMTTWHENESLQDTFWFCEKSAVHPAVQLERTFIIHISHSVRREELFEIFRIATDRNL